MPHVSLCPPQRVYDIMPVTTTEVMANGDQITRSTFKVIDCNDEKLIASFPNALEDTLENQMASGMPLEQVPTTILNPIDSATIDIDSVAYANAFLTKTKDIEL